MTKNSCCFSSLASSFKALKEFFDANEIITRISDSLIHDVHAYYDRIKLANAIMLDKARNMGEEHLCYKPEK